MLNILIEKMIVIANVFPKLATVKSLFRTLSKRRPFRARFDTQHVKASQILAKSPSQRFFRDFSLFLKNLIWKMFNVVLGEILRLFVNLLTVDDKYRVQDCENFPLRIEMQLSEKRKNFSEFFFSISGIYIKLQAF